MKNKIGRIFACFMACLILANTVSVPRAKAVGAEVVGTAALATSTLAAYMTATGVPLTVITGGAAASSAATASLISGYAAATGGTYSVVTTAIASGVTIGTGGVIIISAAAVALLAGIASWIINEYSLDQETPIDIIDYPSGWPDGDFTPCPISKGYSKIYFTDYSDAYVSCDLMCYCFNRSSNHSYDQYIYYDCERKGFYAKSGAPSIYCSIYGYYYIDTENPWSNLISGYPVKSDVFLGTLDDFYYSDFPIYDSEGNLFFDGNYYNVSAELDEAYQSVPELAPQEQFVIQLNLPPEIAPESIPDVIHQQVANNDFNPTFTITAPDPDPDPDVGTDTGGDTGGDSGLNTGESIGWLKRIALACEALGDKILGGIESLFTPDAELVQEAARTFTEKFGFVDTLHQLAMDLLNIDADTEPPVIYIHLEDAEGNIDYGGTVKVLDMSWFARYKEDVDRITGGFLWLGFLWLLFKRASAIINGSEMVEAEVHELNRGFRRKNQ